MGKAIPGHAAWKIWVHELDRLVYKDSNAGMVSLFLRNEEKYEMTIHHRTKQGWQFSAHYIPQEKCGCGKSFSDTYNGIEFKFREHRKIFGMNDILTMIRTPYICQWCYYQKEYLAGRWCPKYYRNLFES